MSDELEKLRFVLAERLEEISEFFKPGAKVSLLVRNPSIPNADLLLTSDDQGEIIKAVQRLAPAPDGKEGEHGTI